MTDRERALASQMLADSLYATPPDAETLVDAPIVIASGGESEDMIAAIHESAGDHPETQDCRAGICPSCVALATSAPDLLDRERLVVALRGMNFDEQQQAREDGGLVECDEPSCDAKREPDLHDLAGVRAAYEHWREHSYLAGCSHGS